MWWVDRKDSTRNDVWMRIHIEYTMGKVRTYEVYLYDCIVCIELMDASLSIQSSESMSCPSSR